jgi:hypothetical protein
MRCERAHDAPQKQQRPEHNAQAVAGDLLGLD